MDLEDLIKVEIAKVQEFNHGNHSIDCHTACCKVSVKKLKELIKQATPPQEVYCIVCSQRLVCVKCELGMTEHPDRNED